MSVEDAKTEIEMGISAVRLAVGTSTAPFFRFPALQHPPELVTYLGERNIAIFSTDLDSFDFKIRKPDQIIKSVMDKLKKHGKGIVLMHDFQHGTAEAIGTLLDQLKLNGYKVVHMRAKTPLQSLPKYDEMVIKEQKLPTVSGRPTAEVVKTVGNVAEARRAWSQGLQAPRSTPLKIPRSHSTTRLHRRSRRRLAGSAASSNTRWANWRRSMRAIDRKQVQGRGPLVAQARKALWNFIVQRESCGLRDARQVIIDYRVPPEVQQAVAVPPLPRRVAINRHTASRPRTSPALRRPQPPSC